MKITKVVAGAVAALFIGGQALAAPAVSTKAADYRPLVAQGSDLVLAYQQSSAKALAPFNALAEQAFEMAKASAPEELNKFLSAAGLTEVEVKWAMLSMFDVSSSIASAGTVIPKGAFVVRFDHKINALVKALNDSAPADKKLTKVTVGGGDAWTLGTGMEQVYIASLDGKLLLCTSDRKLLAQQIALYREGKGVSKKFANFGADAKAVFRLAIADVGGMLKKADGESQAMASMAAQQLSLAAGDLYKFKAFDFALTAGDKGVLVKLAQETGSSAVADSLKGQLSDALAMLSMMVSQAQQTDPDAAIAAEVLNNVVVSTDATKLKVNVKLGTALLNKLEAAVRKQVGL